MASSVLHSKPLILCGKHGVLTLTDLPAIGNCAVEAFIRSPHIPSSSQSECRRRVSHFALNEGREVCSFIWGMLNRSPHLSFDVWVNTVLCKDRQWVGTIFFAFASLCYGVDVVELSQLIGTESNGQSIVDFLDEHVKKYFPTFCEFFSEAERQRSPLKVVYSYLHKFGSLNRNNPFGPYHNSMPGSVGSLERAKYRRLNEVFLNHYCSAFITNLQPIHASHMECEAAPALISTDVSDNVEKFWIDGQLRSITIDLVSSEEDSRKILVPALMSLTILSCSRYEGREITNAQCC